MKWYKGGQSAAKGSYFDPYMWEFIQHNPDKTSLLTGDADTRYLKLPIWLTIITGPVGGLALVLFVPFAGIIGLFYFIISRLIKGSLKLFKKRTANQ